MSVKTVFKTFLGHVLKEMWRCVEGEQKFEWVKLGFGGAQGVRTLFKEKPEVVVAEEDGKSKFVLSHGPYTHNFLVEEKRFKYTRVNGKERYMFKRFGALEHQFMVSFRRTEKNRDKREKAYNIRKRDNESYNRYLEKVKMEKEKVKMEKEKNDEEEEEEEEVAQEEEEEEEEEE